MSTITVSNIKATGETASRDTSGVAGAYGYFNQTTGTAAGYSQNVSSFTDVSAGEMNFNFTNAFSDADYLKAGISSSSNDYMSFSIANSTSSVSRMQNREEGTGLKDAINQVIFHGDLA
jgi:hypothetical protein